MDPDLALIRAGHGHSLDEYHASCAHTLVQLGCPTIEEIHPAWKFEETPDAYTLTQKWSNSKAGRDYEGMLVDINRAEKTIQFEVWKRRPDAPCFKVQMVNFYPSRSRLGNRLTVWKADLDAEAKAARVWTEWRKGCEPDDDFKMPTEWLVTVILPSRGKVVITPGGGMAPFKQAMDVRFVYGLKPRKNGTSDFSSPRGKELAPRTFRSGGLHPLWLAVIKGKRYRDDGWDQVMTWWSVDEMLYAIVAGHAPGGSIRVDAAFLRDLPVLASDMFTFEEAETKEKPKILVEQMSVRRNIMGAVDSMIKPRYNLSHSIPPRSYPGSYFVRQEDGSMKMVLSPTPSSSRRFAPRRPETTENIFILH